MFHEGSAGRPSQVHRGEPGEALARGDGSDQSRAERRMRLSGITTDTGFVIGLERQKQRAVYLLGYVAMPPSLKPRRLTSPDRRGRSLNADTAIELPGIGHQGADVVARARAAARGRALDRIDDAGGARGRRRCGLVAARQRALVDAGLTQVHAARRAVAFFVPKIGLSAADRQFRAAALRT